MTPASPHRLFLALSVPALGLLALFFGQPAYVALALWFIVLLGTCAVLAHRSARGLGATRVVAAAAFEDDLVPVELVLQNTATNAARFVDVVDRFGPAIAERHRIPEAGPLPARSVRPVRYDGVCSRLWGTYTIGPVRLGATDPLGLFRPVRLVPTQSTFSVFPRVHPVAGLVRGGGRASLSVEDLTQERPGQSSLFLGVRDYLPGDDPRRIHWPATARTGALMVREQEVDVVPYLTLFLDLATDHRAGLGRKSTMEYVVRTGASLLATAVRRGQLVQLFAEASSPVFVPPGRGEAHLMLALERLIHVRMDGARSVLEVAVEQLPSLPRGSTAAFLLATAQPPVEELRALLDRLERHGVGAAMVLVDRHSFTAIGQWRENDTPDDARRERTLELLQARAIPHAVLDAEDDLEQRLREGLFS